MAIQNQTSPAALAPWVYQSDEFFALEQEHLFRRNWLLVGHLSDMSEPGDYLTLSAAGEQALVVRTENNSIRAFHNVCQHRGARLLGNPRGHCDRRITCPFHGWSYGFDGSLQTISQHKTFASIDRDKHGLKPIASEIWHGFIFVCFGGSPPSIFEQLAHLETEITPYQMSSMTVAGKRYEELRPYNWKLIHDIDNEGYHVPTGHPSLHQLYGKSYEDRIENGTPVSDAWINEKPARLWSVRHYQKVLPNFTHLPEHRQRCWWYIGVYPNLVFGFYPEMVEYYMTLPVSCSETRYIGGCYALPDSRRETIAARYLNRRINERTDVEDESFVRDMQQNMRSSAFPQPVFSQLERGVLEFHQKIMRDIPVAKVQEQPEPGQLVRLNQQMRST